MLMRDMCPYYAPCGLCTKYDKACNDICGNKNKPMIHNDKYLFNGIEPKQSNENPLKIVLDGDNKTI